MTYTNFPSNLYIAVIDSAPLKLGGFTVSAPLSLKHAVIHIYKHGTAGGSETLTLKAYGSSDCSGTPIGSSSAVSVSSFSEGTYSIGAVRFDFSTEIQMNPDNPIYFALAHSNYTENSTTFYLSCVLDWPFAINTQSTTGLAGVAMGLVGYE
jgi:hypothetical protein